MLILQCGKQVKQTNEQAHEWMDEWKKGMSDVKERRRIEGHMLRLLQCLNVLWTSLVLYQYH